MIMMDEDKTTTATKPKSILTHDSETNTELDAGQTLEEEHAKKRFKLLVPLKIVSILCFMLAIVTFIYPAIPYAKVSNVDGLFPTERINDMQFGSWWAAVPLVTISIIGFFVSDLYGLLSVTTLAILSTLVAIAAMAVDILGAVQLQNIDACVNSNGVGYTGNSALVTDMQQCYSIAVEEGVDCYCVGDETCGKFDTTESCSYLVKDYGDEIFASSIIVSFCFVFSFVFLLLSLVILNNEEFSRPYWTSKALVPPAETELTASKDIDVSITDAEADANAIVTKQV